MTMNSTPKIFDTHAHYDDEAFDPDREAVIASLREHGIGAVVNVGANRAGTEHSLELAQKYDFFYGAAGVHPSDTMEFENGTVSISWLREIASQPKMLAIGEIGLDYYWDTPDRAIQKKWFLEQLALANELDKPVIIHSRDAAKDTLDLIREAGGADMSMVIHCFSYEVEMAREYLKMGHFFGIGGVSTYKNARKLKEVIRFLPLEQILLETDCPYLSPTPHRGKRNSSLNLEYVIHAVAELKEISEEEVIAVTWANAHRFYRLPEPESSLTENI